jgi:hypothetical protein
MHVISRCHWNNFFNIKKLQFLLFLVEDTDISVHSFMGTETYERYLSSGMWHCSLVNMYHLSRGTCYHLHQLQQTCRIHNATSQKTGLSSLYHKEIFVSILEPGCNKNGAWHHSLCVNNLTLLPDVPFCCKKGHKKLHCTGLMKRICSQIRCVSIKERWHIVSRVCTMKLCQVL